MLLGEHFHRHPLGVVCYCNDYVALGHSFIMPSDFLLLVSYLCDLLNAFIGFFYRSALGVIKPCPSIGGWIDFPAKVR